MEYERTLQSKLKSTKIYISRTDINISKIGKRKREREKYVENRFAKNNFISGILRTYLHF